MNSSKFKQNLYHYKHLQDSSHHFFFLFFFFLETVYFHQPDFHFGASSTGVWKNSLRPLGGGSYPFRGLGSGGCRPVFSGRLSTPVFSRELLNGHGRHLHAFGPVCHLRLGSRELWSWSGSVSLKLLLGHSLLSCCLLFLFNLFRISVDISSGYHAELKHDFQ